MKNSSMTDPQQNTMFAEPAASVAHTLAVDPQTGLEEDEVAGRRCRHGPNQLRAHARQSAFVILAHQFKGVIVWLLAFAAGLSFFFHDIAEGVAIVVVLAINAAIGFFTELRAARSMEAQLGIAAVTTRVRRGGKALRIDAHDLVPGDIILLDAGDMVTADLRLAEASNLQCDEYVPTGESLPVAKHTDPVSPDAAIGNRDCMAFKGTAIIQGAGIGIVTATGMETELGHISHLVQTADSSASPMEKRLNRLGHRLVWLTLALAALVIGAGILRGHETAVMIQTGVALVVAAVPEELPVVATLSLARGMWRMAARNAVISNLSSVETLGATTVILNRMHGLVHCCGSGRCATARRWGRGTSPRPAIRWNWRCCASQSRPDRGANDGELTVIEGDDLTGFDPETTDSTLRVRILAADVFARVAPATKLNLAAFYQNSGHIVAMTGDGVNDASALKKADIGIAMGQRGTEVAREAAHMVLKDDSFGTIIAAMRQGRVIFDNIRKFVIYLMSCNVSEVLIVGLAVGVGLPMPLMPLQILFLNLVTDVFPAFALGLGAGDETVMRQPPRDPAEPIIDRIRWSIIGVLGGAITLATLAAFWLALHWLMLDVGPSVTVAFLTLALAQLWNVFNVRVPGGRLFVNEVTGNPWVWAAIALCLGLIAAALWVPGLSDILKLPDPGRAGLLLAAGASLGPLVSGQIFVMSWATHRRRSPAETTAGP